MNFLTRVAEEIEQPDQAQPKVVHSSKSSTIYQAHSYPTKLPPEALVPLIEAATNPGEVILDPFCGSGMVGVAAMQAGRNYVLSDLSPGAIHLARGFTSPVPNGLLHAAIQSMETTWLHDLEHSLYETDCPTCGERGITRHVIWSDVYACPTCAAHISVWEQAGTDDGGIPRTLICDGCGLSFRRTGVHPVGSVPVRIVVACLGSCRKLQEGKPSDRHLEQMCKIDRLPIERWVPSTPIEASREMYRRCALHLRDISSVGDFYLHRSKLALSELWYRISEVSDESIRQALRFAFTNTAWHCTRMRRYNTRGGQRPLTGTLYIPQLIAEANVFEVYRHQIKQIERLHDKVRGSDNRGGHIQQSSATDLSWMQDDSVDYVLTDPPFGANIFYGDCNIVWEAWLGEITDASKEIVVNRSRSIEDGGKTVAQYGELLRRAFAEAKRVLKPSGRMSVVFHNSDDLVWSALLEAAEHAGFDQIGVEILDKGQRSMKGYKGRSGAELVPFYDLVITFRPVVAPKPHLNGAGEIALESIRSHLTSVDKQHMSMASHERSLEYLYSLAVGTVINRGYRPEGLSLRAFEDLVSANFSRIGQHFALSRSLDASRSS